MPRSQIPTSNAGRGRRARQAAAPYSTASLTRASAAQNLDVRPDSLAPNLDSRLDRLEALLSNQATLHASQAAAGEARMARLEGLLEGQAREIIRLRSEPATTVSEPRRQPPASSPAAAPVQPPVSSPAVSVQQQESRPAADPVMPGSSLQADLQDAAFKAVTGTNDDLAPFLQLGATLSEAVKSKVQSKQYIDLSLLGSTNNPQSTVSLTLNPGAAQPIWSLSNSKPSPVKTIADWDRLFRIYSCIYTEAHPSDASGIFTYIQHVHDLARTKPGLIWRDYDVSFRTVRARRPDSLPWGTFNTRLLAELERQQETSKQQPRPNATATGKQPATGFCHAFRAKGFCSRPKCPYLHTKAPASSSSSATTQPTTNTAKVSFNSQPSANSTKNK